jgi:type II secretory pathway pseudopilin PulG
MVELVIVIMVISIMAAAAAPTFLDSLQYHRVESAARRVKADLQLAQQMARLKSASQTVTFTGSSYTLSAGAVALDDANEAYSVDLAASPYEMNSVTAQFGISQAVTFDGYGMPSIGGTVELASHGFRCTVSLDGVTGEVWISSNHARDEVGAVDGN